MVYRRYQFPISKFFKSQIGQEKVWHFLEKNDFNLTKLTKSYKSIFDTINLCPWLSQSLIWKIQNGKEKWLEICEYFRALVYYPSPCIFPSYLLLSSVSVKKLWCHERLAIKKTVIMSVLKFRTFFCNISYDIYSANKANQSFGWHISVSLFFNASILNSAGYGDVRDKVLLLLNNFCWPRMGNQRHRSIFSLSSMSWTLTR
jgi:hypothetical protein